MDSSSSNVCWRGRHPDRSAGVRRAERQIWRARSKSPLPSRTLVDLVLRIGKWGSHSAGHELSGVRCVGMADEQQPAELLAGACAAVLTTYRADGSALTSPVWVGLGDGAFEIVMAEQDGKVRNLRRDPRCLLVIFEARPPFRGIEVRRTAEIESGERVAVARRSIAVRYLGPEAGDRFTSARADVPSVVVRVDSAHARRLDLSNIVAD